MSFEQNELTGALFKNDKQGNEKRPDYTGRCKVGGRDLEMAAWIKESKNGNKTYMSIKFQEPHKREGGIDPSEDVPF